MELRKNSDEGEEEAIVISADAERLDPQEVYEECLNSTEFERPSIQNWNSETFKTVDDFSMGGDAGSSLRFWPSEHMRSPNTYRTWLKEDDYYVLHGATFYYGVRRLPRNYEMVAIHDGEMLPFKLVHVESEEEGFPQLDEIESWDEEDFEKSARFTRENEVAFNFTLVIPPWAFSELGEHHIRILHLPHWGMNEGSESPWYSGYLRGQNFFTTVYYGSECLVPDANPAEDRQDEAGLWERREAGKFVLHFSENFFAPPTEVYDWTEIADWNQLPLDEYDMSDLMNFSQLFESSQREVTFNFYAAEVEDLQLLPPLQGQHTKYFVFRDNELLQRFTMEAPVVEAYELIEKEASGVVVPIDIELTEEPANYRVVSMPDPKNPISPPGPTEQQPSLSNTIQMKYNPDG